MRVASASTDTALYALVSLLAVSSMSAIVVDFRQIESGDDIAFVAGTTPALVRAYLTNKEQFLVHHRLPKRGGRGFRDVLQLRAAPLADCFRALSSHLHAFFRDVLKGYPHDAVHGYVDRRSIRTNAQAHLGANVLLRADIRKFFPSITRARVESFLLSLGCTPPGAAVLAEFLTVRDALPLGLSTSPVLANAICFDLDRDLATLSAPGKYTRYADDLTFSGASIPTKFALNTALSRHGFVLNENKFRLQHRGRGLYVTGLSIEHESHPRVPKSFKRQLRQELRFAEKFGLEDHCGMAGYSSLQSAVNKITGRIQYLRGIERPLGDRLLAQWDAILKSAGAQPIFQSRHETSPRDVALFLDESQPPPDKPPFLAVACVATEDAPSIRRKLEALLKRFKLDPYLSGRKSALRKKGLHWADLTEDMRTDLVRVLAELPVRVFVSLVRAPNVSPAEYEDLYLKLSRFLVGPRLGRYDRSRLSVVAEQNPQVSTAKLKAEIGGLQSQLAASGARRPITLQVDVLGKLDEPCLSLPDAFLAVLLEYALTPKGEELEGVRWRRFEQLRPKYKLIYDADTHFAFSRRNLFFKTSLGGAAGEIAPPDALKRPS